MGNILVIFLTGRFLRFLKGGTYEQHKAQMRNRHTKVISTFHSEENNPTRGGLIEEVPNEVLPVRCIRPWFPPFRKVREKMGHPHCGGIGVRRIVV
jgi:hypothetical protein